MRLSRLLVTSICLVGMLIQFVARASAQGLAKPRVFVLMVCDGLRPDFVTQRDMPHLFELGRDGVRFDRHRFRVKLKAGKNTVLVKAIQGAPNAEPNWEFLLRIVDTDGNAVPFRNALKKE